MLGTWALTEASGGSRQVWVAVAMACLVATSYPEFGRLRQVVLHDLRWAGDFVAQLPWLLDRRPSASAARGFAVDRNGSFLPRVRPCRYPVRAMANSGERVRVLGALCSHEAQRQHARDSLLPLP